MMNYSENTKRRNERKRWFRRMFTVALIMGLIVGFVFGRVTARWNEDEIVLPDPTPVETGVIITPTPPPVITPEPEVPDEPILLGTYRITAYCACEKCCGKWAENRPNGIVVGAAGVELIAGVSCAAPLPFGTEIIIDGLGEYVVQDRTAAWVTEKYENKVVDIYFEDHEAACEFGVQYHDVYQKGGTDHDEM